jgi:hypothetical protein
MILEVLNVCNGRAALHRQQAPSALSLLRHETLVLQRFLDAGRACFVIFCILVDVSASDVTGR